MLRSTIRNWREYLTPVSHKSTFLTTGEITPEEFVQAGDYLCHMFPIWNWNDDNRDISRRTFLPKDKQFLVVRKVTSSQRAQNFVGAGVDEDSDGIVATNMYFEEGADNVAQDEGWLVSEDMNNDKGSGSSVVDTNEKELSKNSNNQAVDIDDMMESMGLDDNLEEEDNLVDEDANGDNKRYYDLYITYSTSYKVPKMYLVGFNSNGSPLTPKEMFEDISPDYRTKTATIENLPFYKSSVPSVSIHPCKHANVMRVLLEKVSAVKQRRMEEELKNSMDNKTGTDVNQDDWEDLQIDMSNTLRVDMYLVIFLKFITSVTPGIEHDFTMEGW